MRYTEEDLRKITESISVLDYFQHLAQQGKVNFARKSGQDYYFRTDENKFSVNETGFYDFKTGEGGKLIKAVMTLENKSWKEALDYLKDFSKAYIPEDIAEIKRIKENKSNQNSSAPSITQITPPNNDKLIAYFNERGISKEVLEAYAKQVHYQVGGKKYFGIGLENQSKGYEIRNPMMKTKLGKNDLTLINKDKGKNVVVFERMTDMLSFLQLQKLNNQENKSTLVALNSVINVDKFVNEFKNYQGKIYLLLDGDKAGTEATNKIISSMPQHNIQDIRKKYGIGDNNINDLNDYLIERKNRIVLEEGMKMVHKTTGQEFSLHHIDNERISLKTNYTPYLAKVQSIPYSDIKELLNYYDFYNSEEKKIEISEKSRIYTRNKFSDKLVDLTIKKDNNETNHQQSAGISKPQSVERGETISNDRNLDQTSQSQHGSTDREPKTLDSHDAGNGLGSREAERLGERGLQPIGSSREAQSPSDGVEEILQGGEHRGVGQNLDGQNGERQSSNQENGLGDVNAFGWTAVLELVQNLKGQKPTNEQIAELVNALTEVSEDKTIHLNPNIEITDDIKNLVSQYKSGGIAKEGRGILDEYYTDERLVQAVGNLIKDHFKGQKEIKVLEPSVGTGNFLSALSNLNSKADITAFEINETTAKISKILNPNTNVNLRSFEMEFITDNGQKKDFAPKYDLVIGNPPYGQHRGLYKGLGEESKIARYEDYFIKRSLDVLKEGGTLAMVVPSGWLNRQNNLKNAELTEAYRLPNGVFKATDVGTDIIILKKNSNAEIKDISQYFDQNSN